MSGTILNAVGQPPSPGRVWNVARKCRGIEDNTEDGNQKLFPPALIKILTKFLTTNPTDSNFLLENPAGDGFGTVTCMEDACWCDIILTADTDPARPDGGRADGLGSMDAYKSHCANDQNHIQSRNARLEIQGIPIPAAPSAPSSASSSGRVPMAPIDNLTNRDPMPSSSFRSLPSFVKSEAKERKPEVFTISDGDDSDDEITFIGATAGSSKRPDTKPTLVKDEDDSDEDVKPITASQYEASVKPPHVVAWQAMSLTNRMNAVRHELEELGKLKPATPEDKAAIKLRRGDLKVVEKSFGIKQWTPPSQSLLRLLPQSAIDHRLRETITWPAMPVAAPAPVPQQLPDLPLAPLQSFIDGFRAWKGLDKSTRISASIREQSFLTSVANTIRDNPIVNGLVNDRILEAVRRIQHPDMATWTPPHPVLIQYFPGLRSAMPPAIQPFLAAPGVAAATAPAQPVAGPSNPLGVTSLGALIASMKGKGPASAAVGDMPGAFPGLPNFEDFDGGMEWDRPQTQQGLTELFQDALADFKEDATVEDGLKVLNLESLNDKLPGAAFTLLPHQVLGVAFMVKSEERKSGARGGLLCDAMGLGKTVQTLGIMLARDERPDDYKKAPQLIVAPVALLAQWKAEIESKTTKRWKVHIHHGSGREKTAAGLRKYDIVLTSYGTLRSEALPRKGKARARPGPFAGSDDESDGEELSRKSPLLTTKWYRVVLDEAHNIRNKRTGTCKSVMGLDVLHPWFLTGTPVVNSLKDLGPALRFIGAMDYDDFNSRVGRIEKSRPKLAAKRTQAILRPLIMRRNKESTLNGVKILQLPPKTTNLTTLQFETDERAIYAALEARAQMQVNKFIKEGTLMKNYSVVLVLLTRLRQCVNHPWLLRRKPGEEGSEGDTLVVGDELFGGDIGKTCKNDSDEYGRAVGLLGAQAVEGIKRKLEERHERTINETSTPDDQDMECSICYEPFDGTELVTSCKHLYCKPCLETLFTQPIRDATTLTEEQAAQGSRVCPMCRSIVSKGHIFRASAIFQPPKEADISKVEEDLKPDIKPGSSLDRKGKKRAAPGSIEEFFEKKRRVSDDDVDEVADEVDELEIEEDIPPSTKMKKLLELVQGYLAEDKSVKVLVFSQFVSFLDLLSDFLNIHGIKNIGYRGSMGQSERSEAIRRFSMPSAIADSISVMLISTKAGGVGLNLTMASKVICCDLAWNPATENQAVDRAHRIGQSRPVTVERLVIEDTVEDRLLEIQRQKGLLADGAMGEGAISKVGRLTVENIRRLFAMDREYEGDGDD